MGVGELEVFEVRSGKSPYWIEIVGHTPPLSLQAKKDRKGPFQVALGSAVSAATDFTLLGDIRVEIDWYIDPWDRYENNKVADIDNIVKPILDAISGIDGIFLDDGQVQAIDVRWIDKLGLDRDFRVRVDPLSALDAGYARQGLRFAKFSSSECYPVLGNFTQQLAAAWVSAFASGAEARQSMESLGASKYDIYTVKHLQRAFPTSRLRAAGYTPVPWQEFLLKETD